LSRKKYKAWEISFARQDCDEFRYKKSFACGAAPMILRLVALLALLLPGIATAQERVV